MVFRLQILGIQSDFSNHQFSTAGITKADQISVVRLWGFGSSWSFKLWWWLAGWQKPSSVWILATIFQWNFMTKKKKPRNLHESSKVSWFCVNFGGDITGEINCTIFFSTGLGTWDIFVKGTPKTRELTFQSLVNGCHSPWFVTLYLHWFVPTTIKHDQMRSTALQLFNSKFESA